MKRHIEEYNNELDLSKGDLVKYVVESFYMTPSAGYVVDKKEYTGIILSNIVHAKYFSQDGSCYTFGNPIVENNDMPYFKIYSIEEQQVVFICYDKIEKLNF